MPEDLRLRYGGSMCGMASGWLPKAASRARHGNSETLRVHRDN